MIGKTDDIKQWTDPKDYGLPFVEVVPLKDAQPPKKEDDKLELIDVAEVKKKTIQAVKLPVIEAEKVSRSEYKVEEKKSSNSWVWIAAVLALAIVVVIIWQINKSVITDSGPVELVSESSEGVTSKVTDEVAVNSTPSDEVQLAESQGDDLGYASSDSVVTESSQTGTTIASTQPDTLIRVEGRADRPYFYVIVGSLANEAMALEEAKKYKDRTDTLYLILPYEGVSNYRLAIAGSPGFTAMTEELARVKDQYNEELWILKY